MDVGGLRLVTGECDVPISPGERCKLLYIDQISNKVFLHSTENYIQYPMINHNGKEYKKKNVYICITEALCCTAEINTTL